MRRTERHPAPPPLRRRPPPPGRAQVPYGVDLAAAWSWRLLVIAGAAVVARLPGLVLRRRRAPDRGRPAASRRSSSPSSTAWPRRGCRAAPRPGSSSWSARWASIVALLTLRRAAGRRRARATWPTRSSRASARSRTGCATGRSTLSDSQIDRVPRPGMQDAISDLNQDGEIFTQVTEVGAAVGPRVRRLLHRAVLDVLLPRRREPDLGLDRAAVAACGARARGQLGPGRLDLADPVRPGHGDRRGGGRRRHHDRGRDPRTCPSCSPSGCWSSSARSCPMIGATIAGSVAVLVALVDQGPITALIMLGVVIGVQQLEGHILQPFLMGRWVSVHPLGVILAIGDRRHHRRHRRCARRGAAGRRGQRGRAAPRRPTPTRATTRSRSSRRTTSRPGRPSRCPTSRTAATKEQSVADAGLPTPDSPVPACPVTLADIEAARELIRDVAIETPMEQSRWLSALVGGPVSLKAENLQRTGLVQGPRRLHPDLPAHAGGARPRRRRRLGRQPRPRGRARGAAARHPLHRLHARRGADPQGAGHPGVRRRRGVRGQGARGVAGRGAPVRRRDRGGADPPVRPRRHHQRRRARSGSRCSSRPPRCRP